MWTSVLALPGPANGENEYEGEVREFDPIKLHNYYCPWVNGNVAAAGCGSNTVSSSSSFTALSGWQLTLDALDTLQSVGHVPIQTMQSESAASLYKVKFKLHTYFNIIWRYKIVVSFFISCSFIYYFLCLQFLITALWFRYVQSRSNEHFIYAMLPPFCWLNLEISLSVLLFLIQYG